ncbi:Myoferlin, partial [Acanthisitta chloris]
QPQVDVPDVLLWLVQGPCPLAPATDIIHSPSGPDASGRLCGRIQTIFLVRG